MLQRKHDTSVRGFALLVWRGLSCIYGHDPNGFLFALGETHLYRVQFCTKLWKFSEPRALLLVIGLWQPVGDIGVLCETLIVTHRHTPHLSASIQYCGVDLQAVGAMTADFLLLFCKIRVRDCEPCAHPPGSTGNRPVYATACALFVVVVRRSESDQMKFLILWWKFDRDISSCLTSQFVSLY